MNHLKLFFKSELIEFYCTPEYFGVIPEPIPANRMMPEWFKRLPVTCPSIRDANNSLAMTAKKCTPLIDAMSLGFIIPAFGDVNVRVSKCGTHIEVGNNPIGNVIEFHDKEQLGGKLSPTYPGPAIKFINKWVVKTAPGYSTLFIPPINHIESRFTCLSGLVDTDNYPKEINFPAIWHEKDYDGIVYAGTPLVTCIPIKRKDITKDIKPRVMTEKEIKTIINLQQRQLSRRGVYTNELKGSKKCTF